MWVDFHPVISKLIKPRESFAYCALSHIKLNHKGSSVMLSMQIERKVEIEKPVDSCSSDMRAVNFIVDGAL